MKCNRYLLLLGFATFCWLHTSGSSFSSRLLELDKLIGRRAAYIQAKEQKLNLLKQRLVLAKADNQALQYKLLVQLYEEYKLYSYDSAFCYIERAKKVARQLGDNNAIADCKVRQSFSFISSGLFVEAVDTLRSVASTQLSDEVRLLYLGVYTRLYSDLSDYAKDSLYSKVYLDKSREYARQVAAIADEGSYERDFYLAILDMKPGRWQESKLQFENLFRSHKLSDGQIGVVASCLSFVCSKLGNDDEAMLWLIRSAMSDIRASTHETVALRNLALSLFSRGDIERAYQYINVALDDARRFNARQRKVELAAIMPIIEGERMSLVEDKRRRTVLFALVVSVLAIFLVVLSLFAVRQLKRVAKVKLAIQEANGKLEAINRALEEANHIKDEYIGHFFNANSEYISRIEVFQKSLHRKIVARQYDDLLSIIKTFDLKIERELLYQNFDKIFIRIFPNFVAEFNALFGEDDRIMLKKGEILSPEMRIYALIRLGFKDNDKIAKFLNYSVSTVYTYKTKLKSKSPYRDCFEERVMGIKAL